MNSVPSYDSPVATQTYLCIPLIATMTSASSMYIASMLLSLQSVWCTCMCIDCQAHIFRAANRDKVTGVWRQVQHSIYWHDHPCKPTVCCLARVSPQRNWSPHVTYSMVGLHSLQLVANRLSADVTAKPPIPVTTCRSLKPNAHTRE